MTRRRPHTGFTLTEILVVIGIIGVLIAILLPVMSKVRETSKRTQCMSNLRQIGQALFSYATDNRGGLPRIQWRKEPGQDPPFVDPLDNDPSPFSVNCFNSNSAALFLLVREGRLTPNVFICPSTDDQPDPLGGQPAVQRSNFTNYGDAMNGVRTRSYTYARLYPSTAPGAAGLTNLLQTLKPDFALAADHGIPICANQNDERANWHSAGLAGNSLNHNSAGQNVLYADGRVTWQTTNRCGVGGDNIYKGVGGTTCSHDLANSATDSVLEERN